MKLVVVAVIGIALSFAQAAHSAAACRTGDVLAPFQQCPIYETVFIELRVSRAGELCFEPPFIARPCAPPTGPDSLSASVEGVEFSYEAEPLASGGWKLVSVSPEPPYPNHGIRARGEIPLHTIRDTVTVVATPFFRDLNGDDLAYSVEAAESLVYSSKVGDDWVSITPESFGFLTFTIRATDPGGESATQDLQVEVIGEDEDRPTIVPLFVSGSNSANGQQGLLRVINRSNVDGNLAIKANDDAGYRAAESVSLSIGAGESINVNASDLEMGNEAKGIVGAFGQGQGDWWLEVESDLDLDVLAYVRTDDGFVTNVHDVVPVDKDGHRVVFFNPGSNTNQVSRLRVVNLEAFETEVEIVGIDDSATETDPVRIAVPALGARVVTAAELEMGDDLEGSLGDGVGKWRLRIRTGGDVLVMSLLDTPAGYLANLSSTP